MQFITYSVTNFAQWISICIDGLETSNVNIRVDEHSKIICNPKLV
jgi:hypothetical protein